MGVGAQVVTILRSHHTYWFSEETLLKILPEGNLLMHQNIPYVEIHILIVLQTLTLVNCGMHFN